MTELIQKLFVEEIVGYALNSSKMENRGNPDLKDVNDLFSPFPRSATSNARGTPLINDGASPGRRITRVTPKQSHVD